jgi:hypothetical protein
LITGMILNGTVAAVASNAKHEFSKQAKESIKLIEDHGVEGDAHAGRFMQHRYLAKQMSALLNNRQVHLIASELFADLTSSGFTVAPGELGECDYRRIKSHEFPARDALAVGRFSGSRAHGPSNTMRPD